MGSTSREIKSPTATATGAASVSVGDNQSLFSTTNGRKKLEAHFLESDDRRGGVLMARAYAAGLPGGTTPVDIRGQPLSDDRLRNTGGWVPTFFIFGNEMAERLAYFGLSVNMVIFMFYVMHRPFSSSANAVNIFLGISQASSVIGGFIADAYLGRYWTIAIFSTIYLAGLTGITLGATLSVFMPNQQDCDQIALLLGSCEAAKPWQMSYLYAFLYLTGFGAAGIRPCVSSFGADQFDETSEDYKSHLERFFNAFYLAVTLGAILAFTAVVYIQMEHGWGSAFGCLAIAMAVSNLLFFLGTPTYRHRLPGGSPLTRVAQVLAAAIHKRKARFSSSEMVGLYELPGKGRSSRIPHTDGFRWLDKAALQLKEDCANPNPWRLCTVTQVEEVKILIRMIPVSACTIMLSLILTEFLTLSVQQAYTLNTHIGRLKVPVTCMPVFPCVSIFLMLSLYYSVFVPLSRRLTGHPHGVSQLQRMGIGLALSVLSVAWAGVFERFRRNYAIKHSYEAIFLTPMPDLSAYWLLIQYCLIGIAEVFCIVGLLEFLYEEAPDAMRSIGSAYAAVAGGLGCFAASLLNSIVKSMTRTEMGGTEESWLSQNINKGKFDYLYWLLTVVSLINFFGFLYAARKYKYRRTDR